MPKSTKDFRKPTHDEISALALRIYEKEGRPQGKAMEHWLRAEAQLKAELSGEAAGSGANSGQKTATAPKSKAAPAPQWPAPEARTTPARQGIQRN